MPGAAQIYARMKELRDCFEILSGSPTIRATIFPTRFEPYPHQADVLTAECSRVRITLQKALAARDGSSTHEHADLLLLAKALAKEQPTDGKGAHRRILAASHTPLQILAARRAQVPKALRMKRKRWTEALTRSMQARCWSLRNRSATAAMDSRTASSAIRRRLCHLTKRFSICHLFPRLCLLSGFLRPSRLHQRHHPHLAFHLDHHRVLLDRCTCERAETEVCFRKLHH